MIEDRTMDIKRDIPFVLNSVDYEDTYDGDMTSNRRIIYTMNFTAKIYLYKSNYKWCCNSSGRC